MTPYSSVICLTHGIAGLRQHNLVAWLTERHVWVDRWSASQQSRAFAARERNDKKAICDVDPMLLFRLNEGWNRVNVFGVATRLLSAPSGVRILLRTKDFHFRTFRPALQPTQRPIQSVPVFFRGGYAYGAWCWPLASVQGRGYERN